MLTVTLNRQDTDDAPVSFTFEHGNGPTVDRVAAIKWLRFVTGGRDQGGLGLREAKDEIDDLLGLSIAQVPEWERRVSGFLPGPSEVVVLRAENERLGQEVARLVAAVATVEREARLTHAADQQIIENLQDQVSHRPFLCIYDSGQDDWQDGCLFIAVSDGEGTLTLRTLQDKGGYDGCDDLFDVSPSLVTRVRR